MKAENYRTRNEFSGAHHMNKRIITTCMLVLVVSASGCFDTDGESAERMAVRDTDRAPQGEYLSAATVKMSAEDHGETASPPGI